LNFFQESPVGIDPAIINEIIQRVRQVAPAEKIILFGSAATDRMNRDSDIDLLILVRTLSNPREESIQIRAALRGMGYPFDIIVMAVDRYEETKDIIGTIAYPANKYGKTIYEAA
jgi:predicted nucleotidyltransferase